MKNILITRPKEQSAKLTSELENAGFKVFVEPVFLVEKLTPKPAAKFSKKDLEKPKNPKAKNSEISAIILTSANSCEALVEFKIKKDVKIFCVGKKTAEKLLENGFKNVEFSDKNSAKSLAGLIKKTHKNKSSQILYFRGSTISFDFKKELKKFGFLVKEIRAYKTKKLQNFSPEFLKFCEKNSFQYVLIFSQKSAENFLKLVKKHNLLEYFQSAQILCLSAKIAEKFKQVREEIFIESAQKKLQKKIKNFSAIPTLKKFYD